MKKSHDNLKFIQIEYKSALAKLCELEKKDLSNLNIEKKKIQKLLQILKSLIEYSLQIQNTQFLINRDIFQFLHRFLKLIKNKYNFFLKDLLYLFQMIITNLKNQREIEEVANLEGFTNFFGETPYFLEISNQEIIFQFLSAMKSFLMKIDNYLIFDRIKQNVIFVLQNERMFENLVETCIYNIILILVKSQNLQIRFFVRETIFFFFLINLTKKFRINLLELEKLLLKKDIKMLRETFSKVQDFIYFFDDFLALNQIKELNEFLLIIFFKEIIFDIVLPNFCENGNLNCLGYYLSFMLLTNFLLISKNDKFKNIFFQSFFRQKLKINNVNYLYLEKDIFVEDEELIQKILLFNIEDESSLYIKKNTLTENCQENDLKIEIFENDLKNENSENDLKNENSENNLNKENSENDLKNENSENDLKNENSENDLKNENSENDLKNENSENDLKKENSQNDLKKENSEKDLKKSCKNKNLENTIFLENILQLIRTKDDNLIYLTTNFLIVLIKEEFIFPLEKIKIVIRLLFTRLNSDHQLRLVTFKRILDLIYLLTQKIDLDNGIENEKQIKDLKEIDNNKQKNEFDNLDLKKEIIFLSENVVTNLKSCLVTEKKEKKLIHNFREIFNKEENSLKRIKGNIVESVFVYNYQFENEQKIFFKNIPVELKYELEENEVVEVFLKMFFFVFSLRYSIFKVDSFDHFSDLGKYSDFTDCLESKEYYFLQKDDDFYLENNVSPYINICQAFSDSKLTEEIFLTGLGFKFFVLSGNKERKKILFVIHFSKIQIKEGEKFIYFFDETDEKENFSFYFKNEKDKIKVKQRIDFILNNLFDKEKNFLSSILLRFTQELYLL